MTNEEIRIPVTILSGFLGAGKTTFLNHLLEKQKDTRYAIIENEFGEQGIDNELVIKPDETIVELNNGCLCCTLNDNLYDILNELYERRDEFDEIIIEATGVADPAGLAQPFIAHPLVKRHFPLTAIICLVDAEFVDTHLEETEEAINQIAFCDILLINKTDLVSTQFVGELKTRLEQMNPLASIYMGHKDQFPQIEYFRNNHKLDSILMESQNELKVNDKEMNFPVDRPHHHHHHDHTEGVNSLTFTFDQPFDIAKLRLQLSVYFTFQARNLFRIKGLIWLENENQQFLLQSVSNRYDFSPQREWLADETRQSVLVFIGKNLQRKGIERILTGSLVSTVAE